MRLGDLADLLSDGDWVQSKDQDPRGEVRLLQLADVGVGRFLDKSARFLTREKARELRCTVLEAGDLMIARMPAPIGRTCIFPGSERPCVTVVDVCILRPDRRRVEPRWLLHYLNSPGARTRIAPFTSGTTRKRISKRKLAGLEFPLPTLAEQRRIAAILDRAEALVRKQRAAIDLGERLLRSTFLERFGDPATNPRRWQIEPLGALASFVGGGTPRRSVPAHY
ncbi:MAG: restriction endonuclease subunit S, partial [Myxococcales bacterium]|nr:restriction endonuclease subunit S [Myxococcales bacterium]